MARKPFDVELAHTMYRLGSSLRAVGVEFGVSAQTVLNRFRESGKEVRGPGDHKRGKPHTAEHRRKIGDAQRGRKMPDEQRRKLSAAKMGIPSPFKGLRKATHPHIVTWGMPGKKHWNWKGGASKETVRLRQSSEYKAWRDQVFRRDYWTCQVCGRKGGVVIEAHHIKSWAEHPLLRFDVSNGQTRCFNCHRGKKKASV